jgi:predicted RNA binding protein YcfA (HicA-like mRNA interferase family)
VAATSIYRDAEGRRTTGPFHSGEILHPKTLTAILRDVGLTADEFALKLRGE